MQAAIKQLISEELRQRFSKATNVLVLSGAGVSAESGVPTFRGGGDAAVLEGVPISVISSAGMVERGMAGVLGWVNFPPWRRSSFLTKRSPGTNASWGALF